MKTLTHSLIVLLFVKAQIGVCQTPGPRDHFGLVYDSEREHIVLFAGNDVDDQGKYKWNPSTWEWNGTSWKLVDQSSAGNVSSITAVYDPEGSRIISVGGYSPEGGSLETTWIYDDNSWIVQDVTSPGPRMSCPIAFDQKNKKVVLFSGCAGKPYPTDTYVFTPDGWQQVAEKGPPGVCRGALFYDEVRQSIVLFGGSVSKDDGWIRSDNMWEWNGTDWKEINVAIKPSGRSNIIIAYDSNRKRAVLFGGATENGLSDELWEWDGSKWHLIAKEGDWPKAVETYGMVYHNKLKKVFLYGGRTGFAKPIADFWSWDGEIWEQQF